MLDTNEYLPGTCILKPHDLNDVMCDALDDIRTYARLRQTDVARGAETAELSALMVSKYGRGLAMAFSHLDKRWSVNVGSAVQAETDALVKAMDPDFIKHQKERWEAKPAGVFKGVGTIKGTHEY